MNLKNFFVSGLVGGIVDYLLGWLLWGILFKDSFPPNDEKNMNMLFIFLGCMTFGFFISYIFTKWTQISNPVSGLKAGAVIAGFLSLFNNFFANSMNLTPDYKMMLTDILLTILCGAAVGAVIAFVNGKMK
jgi:hypothetical protein